MDLPWQMPVALSGILFVLGLGGLLARRNLIFVLMCIEIMLNAAGLMFVAGGARWGQPDGQIMLVLLLNLAAAEIAVGLVLVLRIRGQLRTLDIDDATMLRD
jgi:NADH-quinone oxidoreductase subunit K